ncbi:MAG: C1 family peptidase [Methylocella sp.]
MASIDDTMDYGYDPTVAEPGPVFVPPRPATPPLSNKTVNPLWLPPAGKQTTPSCFVWASTYGLATFAAAQVGNYAPNVASLQASPDYTYVKVLEEKSILSDNCVGGQITSCFQFLQTHNGTPSVQTAPVPDGCSDVWKDYGGTTYPSNSSFDVTGWKKISIAGSEGLESVRVMIAQGVPLAYGTSLYTDFGHYDGTPSPYVGNGQIKINPKKKPVGHVMMIIGYDNDLGGGAVLLQNSFGTGWGMHWNPYYDGRGYVWMAYSTFQTLAQGHALYITSIASG